MRFECLTIFVNNRCNLACRYCYSAASALPGDGVSAAAVRAAARRVAIDCATRSIPFTLALHGGGEPMLDVAVVGRILDIVADECRRAGVALWSYTATNGVLPDETARWMASRFDLVGVSCDGPEDIQDRQRLARDGSRSSVSVDRTLKTLQELARPFMIRVTVTRDTISRQAEIAAHLARYAPGEIRMEPVYLAPPGRRAFRPSDAAAFVSGFLAAQAEAGASGVSVTTSLTRPESVYGRYCNVFRHVLNVVPGDVATLCFLASSRGAVLGRGVQAGLPAVSVRKPPPRTCHRRS